MPKALILAIRSLAYIIRSLLIVGLIVGALDFAFQTAANISNIYILTTDGLQKRANQILLGTTEELDKYFTERFLQRDTLLNANKFEGAGIRNFNHKLKVEWVFAYPWENTGTATVVERVVGIVTDVPQSEEESTPELPEWVDAKYELKLIRDEEGRWHIDQMNMLETALPSPTLPLLTLPPGYTPKPTPTPSPSSTPTPYR